MFVNHTFYVIIDAQHLPHLNVQSHIYIYTPQLCNQLSFPFADLKFITYTIFGNKKQLVKITLDIT